MRLPLVILAAMVACVHDRGGPVGYAAELRSSTELVSDAWPPASRVIDTTRPEDAFCWENFNDIRPTRKKPDGCAPSLVASGRFAQQARPTECPGAMQPAIVGFDDGQPANGGRVPIWTCLPGCGPNNEYVTRWGQQLDDANGQLRVALDIECTNVCPSSSHRASYATAFGDRQVGIVEDGDCVPGSPDAEAAAALGHEQAQQRTARDRSVDAAFAWIDGYLTSLEADRDTPVSDQDPSAYASRLRQLFGALGQLGDARLLTRLDEAQARWKRIVDTHPRPKTTARVRSPADGCRARCDEQEQTCRTRCVDMGQAVCTLCITSGATCRTKCG